MTTLARDTRRFLCSMFVVLCFALPSAWADNGYHLWLKYDKVSDEARLKEYRHLIQALVVPGNSATMQVVSAELHRGLSGLLGREVPWNPPGRIANAVIVVTPQYYRQAGLPGVYGKVRALGSEGYAITTIVVRGARAIVIVASDDHGLLYGAFHFLRLLQNHVSIEDITIASTPKVQYRLLNHWDNPDGTVERGYAGKSLWQWNELPAVISPRYHDYARACASIGINGTVLNNVNANPQILTPEYLAKVAALAGVFRPYGLRVFLSVNFASPIAARFEQEGNRKGGIGTLNTADPLDPAVRAWWNDKVVDIYRLIPDFGGFLVKASSERMPGPQDYNRSHADGANMLAEALRPFGGVVMWRSFVYDAASDPDRTKRSYKEFVPLDGSFAPNVFIQVKNGPLDFQPREPVAPLFGAMKKTPLMLELQITQEYLGQSTHLVYLAPLWKEYLQFDTYARGPGSSLASIIDGTLRKQAITGIAGVANIGDDANWCGHLFAQSNWYAFGRLAWDPALTAEAIADEWISMTFGHDRSVDSTIHAMMMGSREACVNYMTPLGLHHIMQPDVHYGPGPQHDTGRVDWRSTYYHRADSVGLGYDRSSSGSNAVSQYPSPLCEQFDNVHTCPEQYLFWFHHVAWGYRVKSGRTLWDELCVRYASGTAYVDSMCRQWQSLEHAIDPEIFVHVQARLEKQRIDAGIWKDACVGYFQRYSKKEIRINSER